MNLLIIKQSLGCISSLEAKYQAGLYDRIRLTLRILVVTLLFL